MWRTHSRECPDFNSLIVRDGHPRKGREVSVRLNLRKSFALVDMYPPLVLQASASSGLKTFSFAHSFSHACSQEMFTEHLLYGKYHAEPWDYNGEKQVLSLSRRTESRMGGREINNTSSNKL